MEIHVAESTIILFTKVQPVNEIELSLIYPFCWPSDEALVLVIHGVDSILPNDYRATHVILAWRVDRYLSNMVNISTRVVTRHSGTIFFVLSSGGLL